MGQREDESPILARPSPLSLLVSLEPSLPCFSTAGVQAWTTEDCTNLHSLPAVVLVLNRQKLSHIIKVKTDSRSEYPPQQSRPARCAVATHPAMMPWRAHLLHVASLLFKGSSCSFMQREWITRVLWFVQGGPFPFRASRKPDKSSASLNHDASIPSPHSGLLFFYR
jgi:hypothetical protein